MAVPKPHRALGEVVFRALAARKRAPAAGVVWAHEEPNRPALVRVDELDVRPSATLLTRGDADAAEAIRSAVGRALQPHPELDHLEEYRRSEEPGVVYLDAAGARLEEPKPLPEDRRFVSVHRLEGRLLYELVGLCRPPICLELGTAYGVSGMYLLAGAPQARLVTVEADPVRRDAALRAFERFGIAGRVTSPLGLFADVLPALLEEIDAPLRFVFEDGPHAPEVTLQVFQAVIDRVARVECSSSTTSTTRAATSAPGAGSSAIRTSPPPPR